MTMGRQRAMLCGCFGNFPFAITRVCGPKSLAPAGAPGRSGSHAGWRRRPSCRRPSGQTAAPARSKSGAVGLARHRISSAARARRPISRGAAASAAGSSSSDAILAGGAGPRQHRGGRQLQRLAGAGQMAGGVGDALRRSGPPRPDAGSSARMRLRAKAGLARSSDLPASPARAPLSQSRKSRAADTPAAAAPASGLEPGSGKGASARIAAKAVQPAAARQAQQEGLGLVVLVWPT